MQPSKEQIENAARLVHGYTMEPWTDYSGELRFTVPVPETGGFRTWQPWADTEAGSADWAVLDTAVQAWLFDDTSDPCAIDRDANLSVAVSALIAAEQSGDLNQRKAATFAAAVAIGAHMKGVKDGN